MHAVRDRRVDPIEPAPPLHRVRRRCVARTPRASLHRRRTLAGAGSLLRRPRLGRAIHLALGMWLRAVAEHPRARASNRRTAWRHLLRRRRHPGMRTGAITEDVAPGRPSQCQRGLLLPVSCRGRCRVRKADRQGELDLRPRTWGSRRDSAGRKRKTGKPGLRNAARGYSKPRRRRASSSGHLRFLFHASGVSSPSGLVSDPSPANDHALCARALGC